MNYEIMLEIFSHIPNEKIIEELSDLCTIYKNSKTEQEKTKNFKNIESFSTMIAISMEKKLQESEENEEKSSDDDYSSEERPFSPEEN